jgi:hypothetical protein
MVFITGNGIIILQVAIISKLFQAQLGLGSIVLTLDVLVYPSFHMCSPQHAALQ